MFSLKSLQQFNKKVVGFIVVCVVLVIINIISRIPETDQQIEDQPLDSPAPSILPAQKYEDKVFESRQQFSVQTSLQESSLAIQTMPPIEPEKIVSSQEIYNLLTEKFGLEETRSSEALSSDGFQHLSISETNNKVTYLRSDLSNEPLDNQISLETAETFISSLGFDSDQIKISPSDKSYFIIEGYHFEESSGFEATVVQYTIENSVGTVPIKILGNLDSVGKIWVRNDQIIRFELYPIILAPKSQTTETSTVNINDSIEKNYDRVALIAVYNSSENFVTIENIKATEVIDVFQEYRYSTEDKLLYPFALTKVRASINNNPGLLIDLAVPLN